MGSAWSCSTGPGGKPRHLPTPSRTPARGSAYCPAAADVVALLQSDDKRLVCSDLGLRERRVDLRIVVNQSFAPANPKRVLQGKRTIYFIRRSRDDGGDCRARARARSRKSPHINNIAQLFARVRVAIERGAAARAKGALLISN